MTTNADHFTIEHLTTKQIGRIFAKIKIDPAINYNGIPCWLWTGAKDDQEYGLVKIPKTGKITRIHRLLFAWLVGPLPRGVGKNIKQLDHQCDRESCGNPAHTILVLPKANNSRSQSPCAQHGRQTHCINGHPLSGNNLYEAPDGRRCRICKRQRRADNREKVNAGKRASYHRLKERKSRDHTA